MEATAWIALVALGFTGAQAWIAHRKLRFDLYSKRFEVWDSLNILITEYMNELTSKANPKMGFQDSDNLKEIWIKRRSMVSLFPPDVRESLDKLERDLIDYALACSSINQRPSDGQFERRYDDRMAAQRRVLEEQAELANRVHLYIRQYGWIELFGIAVRKRVAIWRASQIDGS